MHPVLNRNVFFVKEHVGMFQAASNYDIYDPQTNELLMECRENIGFITKLFRFTEYKRMTPFNVEIHTPTREPVLRVHRGINFFLSDVKVHDEENQYIGGFKQKFFSIGGAFRVLDMDDNELCTLKGKWTGWDFRFMHGETEYAHVSKKWAGMAKEMFTSADNYVLQISEHVPPDNPLRILILAAVMCIDQVLKED